MRPDDRAKNWIEVAAKGMQRLESAYSHGNVMAARANAAQELGVSRQTLRNHIDCFRFVSEIEQRRPEAALALRSFSATVVAVYSRWYKYDPEGALDHAIAARGLPAPTILAAEKAARKVLVPSTLSPMESVLLSASGSTAIRPSWPFGDSAPSSLDDLRLEENRDPLSLAMGVGKVLAFHGEGSLRSSS